MPTTLGREILRSKLPDQYKNLADKVWDKKTSDAITTQMAQDDPDAYIDILQNLNNFAQTVVSTYGRDAALPFRDLKVSTNIRNINAKIRQLIDNVLNDDKLTDKQKEDKITAIGYKYTQKVEDAVFDDMDKRKTALASQINSGARGKKVQLRQMLFGDMLMKDALNRDMPYLMMDAYADGATPTGYWVSASSGRKGYYDVQMATGQSGYLGKRVTAATHDTIISEPDCGTTDTGVPFPANSTSNVGAVLLKPWHNYPAGTVVTSKMVAEADDDDDEMILRSPMTCKSRTGVCAKCNGLGENGRFPGIGEYVSLNAARSFVEPVTQGAVGSKHEGGIGGKKVINPEGEDQPTGFRSLERMFTTPSNFQGGAVLAPIDGTVSKIQPAAQGGTYVTVGNKTLYCSPYRTIKVKEGDKVYAGDVLTNGIPNPMDVVGLKGLGAGRVYFTKQLGKILKESGWGTERRNLESFSRAFLNKVEITNPDGYHNYLPGDTVNYSELMGDYEPRDNSEELSPDKAVDQYLERPALYYTVGTRITPEVAADLKKYKFDSILVNKEAPPFASKFMRPAEGLQHDKNWLPRLSGERLREGLFDAARQGITDSYDSNSYVDKIIINPLKPT